MQVQHDSSVPAHAPISSREPAPKGHGELRGLDFAAQEAALRPHDDPPVQMKGAGAAPMMGAGGIVSGGPKLVEVQKRLNEEGFDCGPADGIMGPRTRGAIVAFQRARGLDPDGIVGPLTCGALGIEPLAATGPTPASAPLPGTPASAGPPTTTPAGASPSPATPATPAPTASEGPAPEVDPGAMTNGDALTPESNSAFLRTVRAYRVTVVTQQHVAETQVARSGSEKATGLYDRARIDLGAGTSLDDLAEQMQASSAPPEVVRHQAGLAYQHLQDAYAGFQRAIAAALEAAAMVQPAGGPTVEDATTTWHDHADEETVWFDNGG